MITTPSTCQPVSICIPAHNSEKFLRLTFESIENQTHQNWELVFIDDNSSDSTSKIFEEFALRNSDKKCIYQRNSSPIGPARSRNLAATLANSEILAFLDSDDYWYPNHLELMISVLINQPQAAAFSSYLNFSEDVYTGTRIEPSRTFFENIEQGVLYLKFTIRPSGLVIWRSLFNRINGFDSSLFYAEDIDLSVRLLRQNFGLLHSGQVTWAYRTHPANLSSNAIRVAEGIATVWDMHSDWSTLPKKLRRSQKALGYYNLARLTYIKEPKRGLYGFLLAWTAEPENLKLLGFAIITVPIWIYNFFLRSLKKKSTAV